MDAAAESGRNPVRKHHIDDSARVRIMSRLMRDRMVEPVSRDQIIKRERGQKSIHFPCSSNHEQDRLTYLTRLVYYMLIVSYAIHNPIIIAISRTHGNVNSVQ